MTETRFSPLSMGNRLLARLPADEYERLLSLTRLVTLEFRQVLYEPQALLDHLYFPNQGVISMVMVMESGAQIEVATVGKEGVVGLSSLFGAETSFAQCVVQVPGTALRLRADVLRQETRRDGPLRQLLYLYQAAFIKQVAQSVACNGLHTVQQRCCRWLLSTRDRVDADVFPLTHEFLANMLGVRRSSVTEVLLPLREQGLIRNLRGKIAITDRAGLEALSCECYRTVRQEYDLLFA